MSSFAKLFAHARFAPKPWPLCIDQGCPHHGTDHVCVTTCREPCEYCGIGPCENCMNTGLKYPTAADLS